MSGFFKRAQNAKHKTKTLSFTNFSTLLSEKKKDTFSAISWTNCDCADGLLKFGVGIKSYDIDLLDVDEFFIFDSYFGLGPFYGAFYDGAYYRYNDDPSKPIGFGYRQDGLTNMKPFRVFAEDNNARLLAVGDKGVYIYDMGKDLFVPTIITAKVRTAIAWQSRIFCALDRCEIVYSSPLDPTDFMVSLDAGGTIYFPRDRGEIVAIEDLNGALYIFYERGIAKLTTAGSPKDFVWEPIGYAGGRILSNSAKNCGESIFFLAEDGAYRFDGRKAEKIAKDLLLSPQENGKCACGVADGYYYAVYQDEQRGKSAVAIDCQTESGFFFFTPSSFCFWHGQVFVSYNDQSGLLQRGYTPPDGALSYFTSDETDFSLRGLKRVKRITLHGKGHYKITLRSGEESETFEERFTEKAVIYPLLRGEKFTISIELVNSCELRGLEVEAVALRE